MYFCFQKTIRHFRDSLFSLVIINFRAFSSFVLLLLITSNIPAQQNLQPGALLPEVVSLQHSDQSYALYLPSAYSPNKPWPIVYAFDPGARGRVPVDLMRDAAEKYGYIVVGSNNSRNGSGKIQADAVQAIFQDTHARLSIDERRIYFAGFSGGARLSAELAQRCNCAAGVILSGAGYQADPKKSRDSFAVFAAVGSFDFNYGEVVALDSALQKLGAPHFLRRFEGPHQWPSGAVLEEALAWLRLQAMKTNREPRDDSFIAAQMAAELERAQSFEKSDLFSAWFEYRQAEETFATLSDNAKFDSQQKALAGQKPVTDAAKREKQGISDQGKLSAGIYSGLAALSNPAPEDNTVPRASARNSVREEILALKARADHESHPDKQRVMKRALGGIFVSAMEAGLSRTAANDTNAARDYFELALAADPDSIWALTNLAVARAANDRKGAFEILQRLKEKWADRAAFSQWLNSQAAFAKFRDTTEFRSLLQ
jgi:predicted esterase